MIFAAILAGGTGTRMGNPDKPKQFLMLGEKPILVHTVEKFCVSGVFEEIVVLCPESWVKQTEDIVHHYLPRFENVHVRRGGETRNDTIMNALAFIEETHGIDGSTIIVTHDAVRPFVTHRIIQDNIEAAQAYGACDTVIPAVDTIVESADGEKIANIPNRKEYYQGQTPQSFKAKKLKELHDRLTDEQRSILTDACKIFTLMGEPVMLVRGDVANMKITYPQDMRVARAMLAGEGADA